MTQTAPTTRIAVAEDGAEAGSDAGTGSEEEAGTDAEDATPRRYSPGLGMGREVRWQADARTTVIA
ncbi:hypothetical protein GCM10022383_00460 [Microbacterium soli]|uniref:Uncharacterized protein n=1 Tax=Microbacterium soli TaxID=446075 RepID=A0ABP7MMQ0_9MICO